MVEAKTRVEIEPEIIKGNPFYGNINKISVLEDIAKYDKDARDIIAPCGVFAVFKVRDNTKISIKVSITKNIFIAILYFSSSPSKRLKSPSLLIAL